MIAIDCLKCTKGKLLFSEDATYREYIKKFDYLVNEKGELLTESIPIFLTYKCNHCGREFKLSFKEVEESVRKAFADRVFKYQSYKYIQENFHGGHIKDTTKMILCGECTGFDGNGNCPDGFYKKCAIRKKEHGIQLS